MNSRDKEIQSVEAGGCAETYPCQHSVTITFKDGTTKEQGATGPEVAKKYFNYLNDRDKKHFSEYRKKSGFFTRWFEVQNAEAPPSNKYK